MEQGPVRVAEAEAKRSRQGATTDTDHDEGSFW